MSMSVLKIKNGKYITIRRLKRTMMLCAVEIQNEYENGTAVYPRPLKITSAPLVDIVTNGLNQNAFKISYNNNWYWVKADSNRLQLDKDGDSSPEPFWFERENLNTSEYYGLRFVHQSTTWYLSTTYKHKKEVLTITKNPEDCVHITVDKRN